MLPMVGNAEEARHIVNSHEVSSRTASAAWRCRSRMTATGRARSPTSSPPPTSARRSSARSRPPRASRTPTPSRRIDGVDCLWVGHFDLSVSLGIPGEFDHPKFLDAIERVVAAPPQAQARRSAGWCRPSSTGIELYDAGLRFHLLFRRRLGAAQRAGRGDRRAARRLPSGSEGKTTMADTFRVALSGDFRKADGSPTYPDFDLDAAAHGARASRWPISSSAEPACEAEQLEDFDALILLAPALRRGAACRQSGRLARRRPLRRRLRHGRRRRPAPRPASRW